MSMSTITTNAELAAVAEPLQRSTVEIQGQRTGGSGVIWQSDGLIITNAHVVRGRSAIVRFWDGRERHARVIQKNTQQDLAALVVNASGLPTVSIHSAAPRVGELVLAVGNPLGLTRAVSFGMVHALVPSALPDRPQWIQSDLRLAPGNSGGLLANTQGQVIGINTLIAAGRAVSIPSFVVERFLASQQEQSYLGVSLQPIVIDAEGSSAAGWLVLQVIASGPADIANVRVGDVLLGINDRPFQQHSDLTQWVSLAQPGESLTLDLLRSGSRLRPTVTLGRQAAERGAA